MSEFKFKPAPWVPFQDEKVLERLRKMTPEEIEKHPNPDFKIKIVPNIGAIEIGHMLAKIKESDDFDKPFVMITGNPCPGTYLPLVAAINLMGINCRNLHCFAMDEWADQDGNIAPLSYTAGFGHSYVKYFYNMIDPKLRMPEKNFHTYTNENVNKYSDMIEEAGNGGADCIYSGPGWAGHIAFIDPCPELIPGYKDGGEYIIKDLNDPYFDQPAQVLTLHPLTIMQNSLHGVFGQSGDIANVPPKAATIGPRDVKNSKIKLEFHDLTTAGTFSSWQRMTSRLITHGPVTPYVPGSIYQLMDCHLYVSPEIAKPIECMETVGY